MNKNAEGIEVLTVFVDKDDKRYPVGSVYRSADAERVAELQELGFLGKAFNQVEKAKKSAPEKTDGDGVTPDADNPSQG